MKIENNFFDFRRVDNEVGNETKFGDIALNRSEMKIKCGEKVIKILSPIQFQILHLVMHFSSQNILLTRRKLEDWIFRDFPDDKDIPTDSDYINTNIYRINNKLKALGSKLKIISEGISEGYKITAI